VLQSISKTRHELRIKFSQFLDLYGNVISPDRCNGERVFLWFRYLNPDRPIKLKFFYLLMCCKVFQKLGRGLIYWFYSTNFGCQKNNALKAIVFRFICLQNADIELHQQIGYEHF